MKNFKSPEIGFRIHQQLRHVGILLGCILPLVSGCVALTQQGATETAVKTLHIKPDAGTPIVPAAEFNVLGRISIHDKNQSFSGSFRWQHLAISDEILLFTPLGQAVAEITSDQNGVRLITSKLEAFYANDVESLTEEVLGWRLPLSGLKYWIQGTHSPTTEAEKDLNKSDQVIAIRQDGWKIAYNHYTPAQLNQLPRPRVLELAYTNLRIKLVIDNWNVE